MFIAFKKNESAKRFNFFPASLFVCRLLLFQIAYMQNIGCLDSESQYYDPSSDIGNFSGIVEGGSTCNQYGWNGNYIGINLEYYYLNTMIFNIGNEMFFGDNQFYIDAINIPTNCNSGVALVYVVTEQNLADGNEWTFQTDISWPFIPINTTWSINACECNDQIDCDNICSGTNQNCIDCYEGDLNDDELVNIIDVIHLVECILNESCTECADINLDTEISILDIILLVDFILNWSEGCQDPSACNYDINANESCQNCCEYESSFFDCNNNCLIDENQDDICDNIPYEEFFIGMELSQAEKDLFIINAIRFEEICLNNLHHLKNPLWTIHETGTWPIYYHVENWIGSISEQAITNLTNQYELIANDWLSSLQDYDSEAPAEVAVKVFGFTFNEGVNLDQSFLSSYNDYPLVTNYNLTNEQSPWEIRFIDNNEIFDQNWYEIVDFLDLYVSDNRQDLDQSTQFFPNSWSNYSHPESINMFVTKFWHKITWDAVAQRQYLKIGGQITDYETGDANYTVFAHEMGHCLFLDDIYDIGKYPDGQELISIMNNSPYISDFDKFLLRIVWKSQKEN